MNTIQKIKSYPNHVITHTGVSFLVSLHYMFQGKFNYTRPVYQIQQHRVYTERGVYTIDKSTDSEKSTLQTNLHTARSLHCRQNDTEREVYTL
jgi:hypothetical protein